MQPANSYLFESGCPSGEANCTLTRSFNEACLTTGNHTVIVDVTCGEGPDNACTRQTTRATSTFSFNSTPAVSLSHTGPGTSGNVHVDVFYNYPNNSGGRVFLDVLDANGRNMWHFDWEFHGEPARSFDINTLCWPNGDYTVKAEAQSCGRTDSGSIGTDQFTFTVQSTPAVVTPVLELQGDGTIGGTVNYSFPAGSSPQNRGIELRWQGTDALIDATTPGELADAAGVWSINAFACPGERGTKVYAIPIGTYCGTTTHERSWADVPSCELSCKEPPDCPTCVGAPVHLSGGGMEYRDADPLPGNVVVPLERTYHSRSSVNGVFGRGWSTVLDARATASGGSDNRQYVFVRLEDGRNVGFQNINGVYVQTYPGGDTTMGTLRFDAAANVFRHRIGGSLVIREFRSVDGRIVSIGLAGRDKVTIVYDAAGKPTAVSDNRGRWSWSLVYGASGFVETINVTVHPEVSWSYAYGNGNLTTVTSPSAALWRTYEYGTFGMTTALDAASRVIESHVYDANGRAITSSVASEEITD